MASHELEAFFKTWEREALATIRLLEALPPDQYDFRPDTGGRSLAELAWHLAEVEAIISHGIQAGEVAPGRGAPGLEKPKEVKLLASGYRRVHEEAVARLRGLKPEDLDRSIPFFGRTLTIRDSLWLALLHHLIHHRGQLSLMCRLAGGTCPNLYGPNREEMAAARARAGSGA